MKPTEVRYLIDCIEKEGFEYAFVGYSDFEEIKDEVFHNLREAYLKARAELAEFLGHKD